MTLIGDSNSYLSSLLRLRINVWVYFGRFFGTFHWCRKVTLHKCPHINVLCVAMHKWWNESKMGDRENWTNRKVQKTESTENLCLLFSECRKVTTQKCFKCSHASMLKWNLGWVTGKTEPMEKFRKLNRQNFCVSGFLSVEYQHWPLWKNWKMATISLILIVRNNFQLLTPPKFGSLVFWVSTETEYQHQPLWKK